MNKKMIFSLVFISVLILGCENKSSEERQKVETALVTQEERISMFLDEFKKFPGNKDTQGKLVKIGKPIISHLRAFLKEKDNYKVTKEGRLLGEDDDRIRARDNLGARPWESPTWMWHVKLGTVKVLDEIGGEEIIEPLIYAIDDSHTLVAGAAAEALAKRKERRAVEPLIKAMRDHLFPDAIKALGEIGDKRAINPLLDELKNKERIEKYDLYEYYINEALAKIEGVPFKKYGILIDKLKSDAGICWKCWQ